MNDRKSVSLWGMGKVTESWGWERIYHVPWLRALCRKICGLICKSVLQKIEQAPLERMVIDFYPLYIAKVERWNRFSFSKEIYGKLQAGGEAFQLSLKPSNSLHSGNRQLLKYNWSIIFYHCKHKGGDWKKGEKPNIWGLLERSWALLATLLCCLAMQTILLASS